MFKLSIVGTLCLTAGASVATRSLKDGLPRKIKEPAKGGKEVGECEYYCKSESSEICRTRVTRVERKTGARQGFCWSDGATCQGIPEECENCNTKVSCGGKTKQSTKAPKTTTEAPKTTTEAPKTTTEAPKTTTEAAKTYSPKYTGPGSGYTRVTPYKGQAEESTAPPKAQTPKPKPVETTTKPIPVTTTEKPKPTTESTGGEGGGAKNSEASTEWEIEMEKVHNFVRCLHGLNELVWVKEIADSAQGQVDAVAPKGLWGKEYHHYDEKLDPSNDGGKYGENMWKGSHSISTGAGVTFNWWQEIDNEYDRENNSHFSQQIWKDTTQLGCGRAKGGPGYEKSTWVACRYFVAGNVIGKADEQFRPHNTCSQADVARCEAKYNYQMPETDGLCCGAEKPIKKLCKW